MYILNGKWVDMKESEYQFLKPSNYQKSFYGKAKILLCEEGRYLVSYDTVVCFLSYGGTFKRLWKGYSPTTMKHINSFMRHVYWFVGGKQWWTSMEAGKEYTYYDFKRI